MNNSSYIFKVCRVHNIEDLKMVSSNGANMIGIHAVYIDRNAYLSCEEKYFPVKRDLEINEKLPISVFEVDSIKNMQKSMPKNIEQVILFQRPIDIKAMEKCCNIYKMPISNMYIQLHHRTTKEYIDNIKEKLCKKIIAVVGLFQDDFEEYFWYLHKTLNWKTDFILIDLSIHQSDLSKYKNNIDKLKKIKKICPIIKNNKVPIILAEDTTVKRMQQYLKEIKKHNIIIKGIDMQNAVEISKKEQRYIIINDDKNDYQAKIRKSDERLKKWKEFLEKDSKKYFS
jgi:phosphoribosylanthranilate isomerase